MKITHKPSTILSVCLLASYYKCRNVSLVRSSQSTDQCSAKGKSMVMLTHVQWLTAVEIKWTCHES